MEQQPLQVLLLLVFNCLYPIKYIYDGSATLNLGPWTYKISVLPRRLRLMDVIYVRLNYVQGWCRKDIAELLRETLL